MGIGDGEADHGKEVSVVQQQEEERRERRGCRCSLLEDRELTSFPQCSVSAGDNVEAGDGEAGVGRERRAEQEKG